MQNVLGKNSKLNVEKEKRLEMDKRRKGRATKEDTADKDLVEDGGGPTVQAEFPLCCPHKDRSHSTLLRETVVAHDCTQMAKGPKKRGSASSAFGETQTKTQVGRAAHPWERLKWHTQPATRVYAVGGRRAGVFAFLVLNNCITRELPVPTDPPTEGTAGASVVPRAMPSPCSVSERFSTWKEIPSPPATGTPSPSTATQPPTPTISFLALPTSRFWTFPEGGIPFCVVLCDWLLSRNVTFPGVLHVVARVRTQSFPR